MAVAMRAKTDVMSLTARYNVSALAFGKDIRVQMKERYKTELAAAMASQFSNIKTPATPV